MENQSKKIGSFARKYSIGLCPVCSKTGEHNEVLPIFYSVSKAFYTCEKETCPYHPLRKDGTMYPFELQDPVMPPVIIPDVVIKAMNKFGIPIDDLLEEYPDEHAEITKGEKEYIQKPITDCMKYFDVNNSSDSNNINSVSNDNFINEIVSYNELNYNYGFNELINNGLNNTTSVLSDNNIPANKETTIDHTDLLCSNIFI